MRLYAFKDQLCKAASESELAETEQRIDEVFKGELEKHARGDADATDTGALGLAMQQLGPAARDTCWQKRTRSSSLVKKWGSHTSKNMSAFGP